MAPANCTVTRHFLLFQSLPLLLQAFVLVVAGARDVSDVSRPPSLVADAGDVGEEGNGKKCLMIKWQFGLRVRNAIRRLCNLAYPFPFPGGLRPRESGQN